MNWKSIAIGIGILLLIAGAVYGYRQYAYYKERSAIVEGQEEIQAMLEKETEIIGAERDALLKEKFALVSERAKLTQKVCDLEERLNRINIPVDRDELTEFWRSRGFRPVLRPK